MTARRTLVFLLVAYALDILYIEVSIASKHLPSFLVFLLSTLLVFAFAILHATSRLGWKRMLALLGLTFGVGLFFESLGEATGWIYGPYHYTDQLGMKFLGLVPLLIPLGWFLMSYPSFVIADWLVPAQLPRVKRKR